MIKNIIANYIGRIWGILSNIIFIPLYIHFLGLEGYSIISFSVVLAGLMIILDVGLTATLTKEFASKEYDLGAKYRLFISLETVYFIISIIVILLFFVFSKTIAYNWIKSSSISPHEIVQFINIIGIGVAFQLISQFYGGGLMGLEQQVKANVYQISLGVVRNGLVIIPLIFWPNLYCFFIWQTVSAIIYAIVIRGAVVRSISDNITIKNFLVIDKKILNRIWRFAAGIMLISIVSALNTQMDKLAISKFLPIEQLGYYTLAVSLSQGLLILINPIGLSVFPRLTSLYSENETSKAVDLFYRVFRSSNILLFAFSANLIFFGKDLMLIWTNNQQIADNSAPVIPYLAIGMTMLAIQIIPYYISLSNSFTRYNNILGIVSLCVTFPGYWILTKHFGSLGAAILWGTIQTSLTPVFIHLINRKFIHREPTYKVLFKEIFFPFLTALIIAFMFSRINYFDTNHWGMLFLIGISTFSTLIILFLVFLNKSDILIVLKKRTG